MRFRTAGGLKRLPVGQNQGADGWKHVLAGRKGR